MSTVKSRKRMNPCVSILCNPLSTFTQSRTETNEMVPPTMGGLPTWINVIETISHRLAQGTMWPRLSCVVSSGDCRLCSSWQRTRIITNSTVDRTQDKVLFHLRSTSLYLTHAVPSSTLQNNSTATETGPQKVFNLCLKGLWCPLLDNTFREDHVLFWGHSASCGDALMAMNGELLPTRAWEWHLQTPDGCRWWSDSEPDPVSSSSLHAWS